jgi:hypothetical protein
MKPVFRHQGCLKKSTVLGHAEQFANNILKCEEKMLAEAAWISLGCTSKTRSAYAHFIPHAAAACQALF